MMEEIAKNFSLKRLKKLDWSYVSIWILSVGAAVLALTYKLSSITYGQLSPLEKANISASSSLTSLLHHPLFLPYRFVEFLIVHLGGANHVFALRLASVIFALISIWLFLSIARRWFNRPTYILATILFGSSVWLLHFGRLAIPTVTYVLVPLVIVRTVLWLKDLKKEQASHPYRLLLVLVIVLALTLYIPGAWAFWLTALIWQRHKLALFIKKIDWHTTLAAVSLTLLLLVPLIWGLALEPGFIKLWFGFYPTDGSILGTLELFIKQPMYFLVYGPDANAGLWLRHQPILDAFSAVMALVGLVYYVMNFGLRQARLLVLMLAVSLVIFVLSAGTIGASAGLVYLLVAAGIGYLLGLWRKVFPRNPVAYSGAILLLTITAAFAVFYTTRSYFVAWHYQPATKSIFKPKSDTIK